MNRFFLIILVVGALCSSAQKLAPTKERALLKGIVTSMKGKPLAGETIMLVDEKKGTEVKVHTGDDGKFEVLVPVNSVYMIRYKNFTADMNYTKMQVPPDADAVYEVEIKIEPPKEFVLENVYFDTGKSTLKPSSNKALNDLAEVLKLKKKMVIEIQGHTDNMGTEESNLKLSQSRAEAVKKYLVAKGIGADRVTAKGYGQTMPVADNSSEEGRAKNRRTSVKVLKDN
jgi:outer membrane protein OmpA-like peptidoglycan-associated protein